uniref:Kinesin motor domain-containing protein n=1 Tax=Syphacia muris TaxID=451379 RepID=A0A158R4E1_9BILA
MPVRCEKFFSPSKTATITSSGTTKPIIGTSNSCVPKSDDTRFGSHASQYHHHHHQHPSLHSVSSSMQQRCSEEKIPEIVLPPSLQRFITTSVIQQQQQRQQAQLKIALRLTKEDMDNVTASENTLTFRSSQSNAKNLVKYNFDHLFPPDVTQQQICSICLPDLLQSCFNGSDSCLLYFGATKGKSDLLYSSGNSTSSKFLHSANGINSCGSYPGLFPAALFFTFRLISEFRHRRPDFRHSVRISALHYSQRHNTVSDLFAPTLNGTRPEITVYEDSALGIRIENQREIRVDSAEQAMQLMDELMVARKLDDEGEQRCSHVFFYINLYRYRTNGSHVVGGRSRFCLVDLGLGEKNSKGDTQALTMPVITNLLVALFQGQRYLPSRQNLLCMLLKDSLQNIRSKTTLLFSSLSDRNAENDNIIQMMLKVQRAVRPRKSSRIGSDNSSMNSARRLMNTDSEANSSSEQSCAETVIYLGPSVRNDSNRTLSKNSVHSFDNDKRNMIMRWMENSKAELSPTKVSVEIQCNDVEMDSEMKQYFAKHRSLDDIIEDDEELSQPIKDFSTIDQFLENLQCEEQLVDRQLEHPLSILSLEKNFASTSARSSSENEIDDDDLERAMAASVSSIRSHEILSRLNDDLQVEVFEDIAEDGNTFGDESVETFLDLKIPPTTVLGDNNEKKKVKKFPLLTCCQASMASSSSSAGFSTNPIKKCTIEVTPNTSPHDSRPGPSTLLTPSSRPSSLYPLSNSTKCTLMYSGSSTAARRLAQPLSSYNYKPVWIEPLCSSKLLKKKEGLGSAKTFSENSVFQEAADLNSPNTERIGRRESLDGKKDPKKSKRVTERRNSAENDFCPVHTLPSPYSKVTDARNEAGTYSSGHGSDENGSVYCRPLITLLSPRTNRPRNRESFSASSGYESASGESKNYASTTRRRLLETKRYKAPDEVNSALEKRINGLIQKQKLLRDELHEAKKILGLNEEYFISATSTALQGKTLYEALGQETKILYKRLVACRNHTMFVTCLL